LENKLRKKAKHAALRAARQQQAAAAAAANANTSTTPVSSC
jgi:hypothetical protein